VDLKCVNHTHALVTPAAGESILKPRTGHDALPQWTSLQQPCAAEGCTGHCCTGHLLLKQFNAFQWGEQIPKTAPSMGIRLPSNTSIGSVGFAGFTVTRQKHTHTHMHS